MTRADTTDELEAIRARHEYAEQKGGDFYTPEYCEWTFSQTHRDRATLLKALDALKAENERLRDALQELADGDFHASMSREIARTALTPEAGQ